MSMEKIKKLVATNNVEMLHKINQYNVHSAWFDVDYSGCKFGIFSAACPVEPLHALENGLIPDCLRILFQEDFTASTRGQLDGIARKMLHWP